MTSNVSSNSTAQDDLVTEGLLTGLCVFSALTVLVNCMILIASKYTTAGRSAILVFMRSLCVADLLIGLFGLFKTILLMHYHHSWINCYLPDSLFTSATTTICSTLLWLHLDSYLRLTRPITYGNSMDKGNVIIAMLLVWNGGFIIGFLPQLGWNLDEYGCNFFTFNSVIYISIVSFIWTLCIIGSLALQVYIRRILVRIQQDLEFITSCSAQYALQSQLVKTIGKDMVLLIVSYVPFLIYIYIYFIKAKTEDTSTASYNLIFFLPVFLSRSFCCAFLHSYQTIKLQSLTPNRQGSIVKIFKRAAHSKTPNHPHVFCVNNTSRHMDVSGLELTNGNQSRHPKLRQTDSTVTITTEVGSHCSCSTKNSNASSISMSRLTTEQDSSSKSSSLDSIIEVQPAVSNSLTTRL